MKERNNNNTFTMTEDFFDVEVHIHLINPFIEMQLIINEHIKSGNFNFKYIIPGLIISTTRHIKC